MRGAAAGREFLIFLIRTKPETSRARAGNRAKTGEEIEQVDITQKEVGKGAKWAQVARTKARAKAENTNRHGITSKRV